MRPWSLVLVLALLGANDAHAQSTLGTDVHKVDVANLKGLAGLTVDVGIEYADSDKPSDSFSLEELRTTVENELRAKGVKVYKLGARGAPTANLDFVLFTTRVGKGDYDYSTRLKVREPAKLLRNGRIVNCGLYEHEGGGYTGANVLRFMTQFAIKNSIDALCDTFKEANP